MRQQTEFAGRKDLPERRLGRREAGCLRPRLLEVRHDRLLHAVREVRETLFGPSLLHTEGDHDGEDDHAYLNEESRHFMNRARRSTLCPGP